MALEYEAATFTVPEAALAVDIDGVACTLIEKPDDRWVLAFSIGIQGEAATLPYIESILAGIARLISLYMAAEGEYTPDDGS